MKVIFASHTVDFRYLGFPLGMGVTCLHLTTNDKVMANMLFVVLPNGYCEYGFFLFDWYLTRAYHAFEAVYYAVT